VLLLAAGAQILYMVLHHEGVAAIVKFVRSDWKSIFAQFNSLAAVIPGATADLKRAASTVSAMSGPAADREAVAVANQRANFYSATTASVEPDAALTRVQPVVVVAPPPPREPTGPVRVVPPAPRPER
jgi:predicted RNA polymerase sigma factor